MMEHYRTIKPLECTVVGPGVVVKVEEEEIYTPQNDQNQTASTGGASLLHEGDLKTEHNEETHVRRRRKPDRRKGNPEKNKGSVNLEPDIVIKTEDDHAEAYMRNDYMFEDDQRLETRTEHNLKPEIEVKLEENDQSYAMVDQHFEERDSSPAASPDYFLVQVKEEEEDMSFGMDYQQHGEKVVHPQTSTVREKDGRIHRMSSKMFIDIAQLIQLVQERPELYNPKTPSYADRYKKKKAWDEICAIVVPDWALCSEKERNIKVKVIKTKWKSLRDRFKKDARESRICQAPNKYRVHPLHMELQFLLPILNKKLCNGNVDLSDAEEMGEDAVVETLPSRPLSSVDIEAVECMPTVQSDMETELEVKEPTPPPPLLPPPPHTFPTRFPPLMAIKARPAVWERVREKVAEKVAEKNEIFALIDTIRRDVAMSKRPQDDISIFMRSVDAEMRKVPPEMLSFLKLELLKLVVSFQQPQAEVPRNTAVMPTIPAATHPLTSPIPPQFSLPPDHYNFYHHALPSSNATFNPDPDPSKSLPSPQGLQHQPTFYHGASVPKHSPMAEAH